MIVDTHVHPVASDTQKYPIDPLGGVQSDWSKGFTNTVDEFLAHMKAAGVDQTTLVQGSTVHGYDNSYTADCCAAHPDRFVGVACTDPQMPDAADVLSYWIEEKGLRGVRVFTTGSTLAESNWLDRTLLDPFWQRARQLKIPVCIQIRYAGIPLLRTVMERYPEIPMLLDHSAGPNLEDGPPYEAAKDLFALSSYPNLYLKVSTINLRAAAKGKSTVNQFFEALVEKFTARHLLWCSNYPSTRGTGPEPYKELVDEASQALAVVALDDLHWIMGDNARDLYPDLKARLMSS